MHCHLERSERSMDSRRLQRSFASLRMTMLVVHFLDQAGADSAEEIFAVGFGLGQDFWLVAVFESYFLQEEFDGIFRLETFGYQLAEDGGEAVGVPGGTGGKR